MVHKGTPGSFNLGQDEVEHINTKSHILNTTEAVRQPKEDIELPTSRTVAKVPSGNKNNSEPMSSKNMSIGAVSQLTTE